MALNYLVPELNVEEMPARSGYLAPKYLQAQNDPPAPP